jgi:predicted transposase YbfD/YdcC
MFNCKKVNRKKNIEFIDKINKLEVENKQLQDKILILEKENIMNIEKADEYRKIVEKLATKTTVKNSYTHNNYLNYISSEPIRFSEIPKQLKDVVTTNSLMFDDLEFHEHIVDNILRDENGKDKVLCTDINRKNFSYKDENSGELICDPELERLREQLRKGTDLSDIKNIKKELLNMLIKKYEGTSVDPYVKFYEILKKLDFGGQFVDHIAKKTYVKTMTSIT